MRDFGDFSRNFLCENKLPTVIANFHSIISQVEIVAEKDPKTLDLLQSTIDDALRFCHLSHTFVSDQKNDIIPNSANLRSVRISKTHNYSGKDFDAMSNSNQVGTNQFFNKSTPIGCCFDRIQSNQRSSKYYTVLQQRTQNRRYRFLR